MPFKKYPKIQNTYQNKVISQHLEYHPQCKDIYYAAQIKLDGSNIQFVFEPHIPMRIAKRSGLIGQDDNFNGILDILPKYQYVIDYLQEYCDTKNVNVNLFGEIYGKGIQNRINYGDGKYLAFFDIAINDEILRYKDAREEFPYLTEVFWVPTVGIFLYQDIFEVRVPEEHEGLVFKPYEYHDGRPLILKKKNEKFEEKMKSVKKEKKPEDPEVAEWKEKFLPYINKNRVLSVFSKEGEIDSPEQIGHYIKLVMEDAIEDFTQDYDISEVDRNKLKQVYKAGNREITPILKEFL